MPKGIKPYPLSLYGGNLYGSMGKSLYVVSSWLEIA